VTRGAHHQLPLPLPSAERRAAGATAADRAPQNVRPEQIAAFHLHEEQQEGQGRMCPHEYEQQR
jgi:hypothetical protein